MSSDEFDVTQEEFDRMFAESDLAKITGPPHVGLHDCEHNCSCFWCKASRREPFETGYDSTEIGP